MSAPTRGSHSHDDLEHRRRAFPASIRDVTRPVVLETTIGGIVPVMPGGRLAGFEAHTKIRRTDWGLTWNKALESGGWLVGDEIRIGLDLEATEAASADAAG